MTLLLVLLALSLPLGGTGTILNLGALPVNLPSFLAIIALAWSFIAALRRDIRPDTAGWAAIGWAGAWLASSLAAPLAWVPASQSAWHLAVGPLLFAVARPLLPPRSKNILLAGSGAASVIFVFLHIAGNGGIPALGTGPAIPWSAFLAKPLTGAGPQAYPELSLLAGLLPRGGLLLAGAGIFLIWALGSRVFHIIRRPRGGQDAVLPALTLLALIASGFVFNPLAGTGLGLESWLVLTALIPPARPAYNGKRRA